MYNDNLTSEVLLETMFFHYYLSIEFAFVDPKRLFQIQGKLAILVYQVQLVFKHQFLSQFRVDKLSIFNIF